MRVSVRLSGFLRTQGLPSGHKGGLLELPPGATLAQALAALGLNERAPYLVTLNGLRAERERPLAEGDSIVIIPPIGGGTQE